MLNNEALIIMFSHPSNLYRPSYALSDFKSLSEGEISTYKVYAL